MAKSVAKKPDPASGTQSIERALGILRLIATNNEKGIRLVDIVRVSDLQKTTCHRIVHCLVQQGMAAERQPGNRYVLGPLAYELGLGAARRYHIGALCHPFLERLADETNDAVFFSVRSGHELSCVDEAIGSYPIKAYTRRVGDRRPLGFGCSGLAILSLLSEREIRAILRKNKSELDEFGVTDLEPLVHKALQAKIDGYALHERPTLGLKALAVSVADAGGRPVGALSLCALSTRITSDRMTSLVELLHLAAADIEARLAPVALASISMDVPR
jgi:DNA-binding IclR family transcriptional regulator